MNRTEHRITLDIHDGGVQTMLMVRQWDINRRLIVNFVENSRPYIPESGSAAFAALKPDGNFLYNACTLSDGVVTYDFTDQTVPVAGEMACEIKLYDKDGKLITSPRFMIIVEPCVYNGEEVLNSKSEFTEVMNLYEKVSSFAETVEQFRAETQNIVEGQTKKADKVSGAAAGDLAALNHHMAMLDETGNLADSGIVLEQLVTTDEMDTYTPRASGFDDEGKRVYGLVSTEGPKEFLGVSIEDGNIRLYPATENQIAAQLEAGEAEDYGFDTPITPRTVNYAVKAALTKNYLVWSETERAAARALIGVKDEVFFKPYADWQKVEADIVSCGQGDLYVLWVGGESSIAYNWPIDISISLQPGAVYHITAQNKIISTCDCLGVPVKVDKTLDAASMNPVANHAVMSAFAGLRDRVVALEETPVPLFKPYNDENGILADAALVGNGELYVLWVGGKKNLDYDIFTHYLDDGALVKCLISDGCITNVVDVGNTQPGVAALREQMGDVATALDEILALQEALIGGGV